MKLYVARDFAGALFLYLNEPERDNTYGVFQGTLANGYGTEDFMELPKEEFPAVTWENSPQLVEVEIYHEPEKIES